MKFKEDNMFFLDIVDPVSFVPDIAIPVIAVAAIVLTVILIFKMKGKKK